MSWRFVKRVVKLIHGRTHHGGDREREVREDAKVGRANDRLFWLGVLRWRSFSLGIGAWQMTTSDGADMSAPPLGRRCIAQQRESDGIS